jgi:Uncharacterized protein conserved in bacteria
MGYDLPPVNYAEPEREEGNGKKIAIWTVVGLLAVGAVVAIAMIFFAGGSPANSDQVVIPADLVGSEKAAAKQELVGLGFPEANIHYKNKNDDTADKGQILAVDPAPQTKVDKTKLAVTQVTLTVSAGKVKVKVPSVKGLSEDEAKSKIEDANLKVGSNETKASATVPKGNVIGTSPTAGTSVDKDSEVSLVISGGPGKTVVPNEVGKREDEARSDLRSHGFQVSVTYIDTPPGQEGGQVLQQNPQEGDSVNRGSTITLTVAKTQQQPPGGGPTFPTGDPFPPGGGGNGNGGN